MELTEKLKQFSYKLCKGEIDWRFINEEASLGENNRAVEILIEERFVKLFEEVPHNLAFTVNDNNQINMGPMYKGKFMSFTRQKYANDFIEYLESLDKKEERRSVKFRCR